MKSKFFRVCICIALCLCLFTGVFAVMGWGSLLRQVGSAVMYPFSWLAGKTADAAAGFAGYFRDIRDFWTRKFWKTRTAGCTATSP